MDEANPQDLTLRQLQIFWVVVHAGSLTRAAKQLEIVVKDSLYTGRPLAFVNLGLCRVQLFDPEGAEAAFVRCLGCRTGGRQRAVNDAN